MAEQSRGILFRKRNILGAALVAGVGLGIYLGQFKGFGPGGNGVGWGTSNGETHSSIASSNSAAPSTETKQSPKQPDEVLPDQVPNVVRVIIEERDFLLRGEKADTPISLASLMKLVKQAPGDQDGLQLKIYEKESARPSAEERLKAALKDAEISENAVVWVPGSVK